MIHILVAGFPRSGNTYLGSLLSCHFNAPYHDLYKLRDFRTGARRKATMVTDLDPFAGMFDRPDQPRQVATVLKTHEPFETFRQVHQAELDHLSYRDARPVVIVREPKDVINSYYYYTFFRGHRRSGHWASRLPYPVRDWLYRQFRLRRFALQTAQGWRRFMLSWQPQNPVVVRYEDVTARPAETVRQLAEALGLEFSAKYMAEAMEYCSMAKMREAEDRLHPGIRDERERTFRAGGTGHWRGLLTPALQQAVDAITHDVAQAVGYAHQAALQTA